MNRDILLAAFNECDADGSGYIGLDEVHLICDKFGIAESAEILFKDLDRDGDGQISFDDFCAGFSEFESNNNSSRKSVDLGAGLSVKDGKKRASKAITSERNNRKEKSIIASSPPLCEEPQSEKIICELLENVRKLQEENNRLAQSWMRDKREHEEHLQHIEQEVDCQVREVEQKVKQKAKEEIEADRKYFREMMKDEMNELQAHLSMFEKVEAWLKSNATNVNDEKFNDFRDQLDKTMQENRQMRLSLLDTQTAVAMMRTELAQLRAQYDSKCRELNNEKIRAFELTHEYDELTKQLQLTQTANRHLKDVNDSFRNKVDINQFVLSTVPEADPSIALSLSNHNHKRGSIIGDYLENGRKSNINATVTISEAGEEDGDNCDTSLCSMGSLSSASHLQNNNNYLSLQNTQIEDEAALVLLDSGLSSTIHDENMLVDQNCTNGFAPNKRLRQIHRAKSSECVCVQRTSSKVKRAAITRDDSMLDNESVVSSVMSECEIMEANGPPERAYNVIFVGDASVGKTSFISRVVKNTFVNNLSATLGIDFHVRTLNVRGKNVTLQLWDTAGQERFRSLTKSYFRKADGIVLMFDVTNEASFLNVRQWMNAIEDISGKILPVVIVGNKTDLRDPDNDSCVKASSGHRIAEQYKVKFFESSVKDGSNVLLIVAELTKLLMENESNLVHPSGLKLSQTDKKSKCCNK